MKIEILDHMDKNGILKEQTTYGNFTTSTRKTWKYSTKTEALQERLKTSQIKEQQSGVAKAKESTSLVFTQKKTK